MPLLQASGCGSIIYVWTPCRSTGQALPFSDACFVKGYPAETAEAFCDGHVEAFAFFGAVPQSILYDNTKLAVARILGDGRRVRSAMFAALQSHYLFEDKFGPSTTLRAR